MQWHLKDSLGGVALHIISVDDDLNDAIPHLFADIVASNADEVENGVHIPGVIHGILLCKYGHFQHLYKEDTKHQSSTVLKTCIK